MKYAKSEYLRVETQLRCLHLCSIVCIAECLILFKMPNETENLSIVVYYERLLFMYIFVFLRIYKRAVYIYTCVYQKNMQQQMFFRRFLVEYTYNIYAWVKQSEIEYKSHFGYIKIWKLRSSLRILYTKNTRDNTTVEMFNISILHVLAESMQHRVSRLASDHYIKQAPFNSAIVIYGETAGEFMLMGVIMFGYGNNIHRRHSRKIFRLLNHCLFINLYRRYSVSVFSLCPYPARHSPSIPFFKSSALYLSMELTKVIYRYLLVSTGRRNDQQTQLSLEGRNHSHISIYYKRLYYIILIIL